MDLQGKRKRKPLDVSGGGGDGGDGDKRQQTLSLGGKRAAAVGPENWRKHPNPLVVAKMERFALSTNLVKDWKEIRPLAKNALYFTSKGVLRINTRAGPANGPPACVECFLLPYTVMVRSEVRLGHNCDAKRKYTLAGWFDTKKLECFLQGDARNGMKEPYQFAIHSDDKVWWQCGECYHEFFSVVKNVTNPKRPTWCPYCAKPAKRLCGVLECLLCLAKSLASWTDKPKLACFLAGDARNGGKQAHEVFLNSNDKVWWQCSKCYHEFCSQVSSVTNPKRS
ncbi:MAG: zinc-ribbon domain-containing protein, partial [Planctomycetales bacterium]